MQLHNVTVRLGGSLNNTVPKFRVTAAEVLVLRHIHGDDSVVDVIPTDFDKKLRHDSEYARLAHVYDRGAGALGDKPGAADERKSIMGTLFPGAVKRLPVDLHEAGLGELLGEPEPVAPRRRSRAAPVVAPVVEEPEAGEPATDEADADEADAADEAAPQTDETPATE